MHQGMYVHVQGRAKNAPTHDVSYSWHCRQLLPSGLSAPAAVESAGAELAARAGVVNLTPTATL